MNPATATNPHSLICFISLFVLLPSCTIEDADSDPLPQSPSDFGLSIDDIRIHEQQQALSATTLADPTLAEEGTRACTCYYSSYQAECDYSYIPGNVACEMLVDGSGREETTDSYYTHDDTRFVTLSSAADEYTVDCNIQMPYFEHAGYDSTDIGAIRIYFYASATPPETIHCYGHSSNRNEIDYDESEVWDSEDCYSIGSGYYACNLVPNFPGTGYIWRGNQLIFTRCEFAPPSSGEIISIQGLRVCYDDDD